MTLLKARIRVTEILESVETKEKCKKENQSCSPIPHPGQMPKAKNFICATQALRGCVYMVLWDGHKQKTKENLPKIFV